MPQRDGRMEAGRAVGTGFLCYENTGCAKFVLPPAVYDT